MSSADINKKVLLIIGANSFFYHQFSLAQVLKRYGIEPVLLFDITYVTMHYDLLLCDEYKISYIKVGLEPAYEGWKGGIIESITEVIKKIEYRIISRFFRELNRSRKVFARAMQLIRENNIGMILMISDLVQSDSGIYIKAAHSCNAEVMIVPLYAANYKEAAGHHYNDPKVRITHKKYDRLKRIKWLSKWVIEYRGRYMIRLPLSYIMVKELMGIAPVNPWTINSGKFNIMAVEGNGVKNLYVSSGDFDPAKIVVTGSLSNDKIYHNLIKKEEKIQGFYDEYQLDPTKKNLLVAIPPDMFSSRVDEAEFDSYTSFVEFWVQNISSLKDSYNILYTIHPSVDKKEHRFFIDMGCDIIHGPTIDYISLFDFYIASISATIQWAILSGIPVLNHDIYRYDYDDYQGVEGVLYTADNDGFKTLLEKFKDLSFLEHMTEIQKKSSSDWGVLDGKGGERIVSYIKKSIYGGADILLS